MTRRREEGFGSWGALQSLSLIHHSLMMQMDLQTTSQRSLLCSQELRCELLRVELLEHQRRSQNEKLLLLLLLLL
jgi:hypothetical protein